MSERLLRTALIVSLAFNLAVAAVVVRGWARRHRAPAAAPAPAGSARIPLAEHGRRLSRCIGLAGERARCFEEAMAGSYAEAKAVKEELESARADLFRLLEPRRPDEAQVMAAVERVAALQERLEKLLVRRLLDSRAVLRPEEDERLLNLIRCNLRSECAPAEQCPYQNRSKDGSENRSGNGSQGGTR